MRSILLVGKAYLASPNRPPGVAVSGGVLYPQTRLIISLVQRRWAGSTSNVVSVLPEPSLHVVQERDVGGGTRVAGVGNGPSSRAAHVDLPFSIRPNGYVDRLRDAPSRFHCR